MLDKLGLMQPFSELYLETVRKLAAKHQLLKGVSDETLIKGFNTMHRLVDLDTPSHSREFWQCSIGLRKEVTKMVKQEKFLGTARDRDIIEGLAYSKKGSLSTYNALLSRMREPVDPDENLWQCNILHTMPHQAKLLKSWAPLMQKGFEQLSESLTDSRQVDFYATFANCLLQNEIDLSDVVLAHYPESTGRKLLEDLGHWLDRYFDQTLLQDVETRELLTLISRLYDPKNNKNPVEPPKMSGMQKFKRLFGVKPPLTEQELFDYIKKYFMWVL